MVWLPLLLIVSYSPVLVDRCEVVEINHVYDGSTGTRQFTQLVGWNDDGVDFWRIVSRVPTARRVGQVWRLDLVDPKCGRWRRIEAPTFWTTWTAWDREIEDRPRRPQKLRRELRTR